MVTCDPDQILYTPITGMKVATQMWYLGCVSAAGYSVKKTSGTLSSFFLAEYCTDVV